MRVRRWSAVAVLVVLLTGCGNAAVRQPGAELWTAAASPDPSEPRWPDRVTEDRKTGALSAPGFNALVDSAGPGWAAAPDTAAAELLDLDRKFDGPVEIYLHQEGDPNEPVVTVTLTRLGDDSIEAMRYRVVFKRGDDGRYRFVEGKGTTKCHAGRGHGSFEVGPCG